MRTLLAAILLLPALALAQAAPQVKMKKDAPKSTASKVEMKKDPRTQAMDAAAANESRKHEALSKTSRKRHEPAPNAKRNER